MEFIYAVWFIPTVKGMQAFGWQPKFHGEYSTLEAAQDIAHELYTDVTAPDKSYYMGYHVIKRVKGSRQ